MCPGYCHGKNPFAYYDKDIARCLVLTRAGVLCVDGPRLAVVEVAELGRQDTVNSCGDKGVFTSHQGATIDQEAPTLNKYIYSYLITVLSYCALL